MKAKSRTYVIDWNWATDEDGSLSKTDEIQATTAPRAQAKLFRELKKEYAEVSTRTVIVHAIVPADRY